MPSNSPACSTLRPVLKPDALALPPDRSTDNCPIALKNQRLNVPLMPRRLKYSDLAMNVTLRPGITSGAKKESEKDRWLLAMIAAPCVGTFSRPTTFGRKISRRLAPSVHLRNQ